MRVEASRQGRSFAKRNARQRTLDAAYPYKKSHRPPLEITFSDGGLPLSYFNGSRLATPYWRGQRSHLVCALLLAFLSRHQAMECALYKRLAICASRLR